MIKVFIIRIENRSRKINWKKIFEIIEKLIYKVGNNKKNIKVIEIYNRIYKVKS